MRKLLKRFAAAASAVVIGGVTCVTTWFSVPVSAAGAFGMLEWLEFQTLLQGIGIGGSNDDFVKSVDNWTKSIGGPEMPREDYDGEWMTNYEYYNRLGWDEIVNWFDGLFSGDNAYSDIADIGSGVPCGSLSGWSASNFFKVASDFDFSSPSGGCRFVFNVLNSDSGHEPIIVYYCKDGVNYLGLFYYVNSRYIMAPGFYLPPNNFSTGCFVDSLGKNAFTASDFGYSQSMFPSGRHNFGIDAFCLWSDVVALSQYLGIYSESPVAYSDIVNLVNSDKLDWQPYKSDSFIGPVYTYPAAQDLYKSTGTAAGIRLDVQTEDGVPDIQAALDGAGVKTVDDLVAGVAAGTVPMSKVFSDAKVTPYVVADTATGAVVTDLGVSATAAGVKAVGLTQELAVPKDLTNAAAYTIEGKTWDPEMSKYNLPLFQYFPFCLPWDIYQVLSAFAAEPVAPSITIPLGKFFSGKKSFDGSAAAGITATVDLGDDKFSKWFVMLRALESAGIVIGLVLISVKLIHGGR